MCLAHTQTHIQLVFRIARHFQKLNTFTARHVRLSVHIGTSDTKSACCYTSSQVWYREMVATTWMQSSAGRLFPYSIYGGTSLASMQECVLAYLHLLLASRHRACGSYCTVGALRAKDVHCWQGHSGYMDIAQILYTCVHCHECHVFNYPKVSFHGPEGLHILVAGKFTSACGFSSFWFLCNSAAY
jgi:hypothetical protein